MSTPRAPGPECESPGSAVRHRGPSDTGLNHPGQLVDPAGYRSQARVLWDSWSSTQDLGPGPESPRADGRHHGPRDTGPSYLGQLVDPAGHRTPAQIARESCSTPRALGHGPKWRGTAGRPHGPSTRARVLRDCWSTPRAHRPKRESPRSARPFRRTSDLSLSRPGQLVVCVGPRTLA